MAPRAVVALALLELEDGDLLALELIDDLAGNLLLGEGVSVNDGLLAVVQQNNVKLDLVARLHVELLDINDVALGNLILLNDGKKTVVDADALSKKKVLDLNF